MINGQNHKGSTYHIGKMLADKLEDELLDTFHFIRDGICLLYTSPSPRD